MGWDLSEAAFRRVLNEALPRADKFYRDNAEQVAWDLWKQSSGRVSGTSELFRQVQQVLDYMAERFEAVQAAYDIVEGTGL